MASLAVDHSARPSSEHPARGSNDLIDARALTAELEQLVKTHGNGEKELRSVLAATARWRSPGRAMPSSR